MPSVYLVQDGDNARLMFGLVVEEAKAEFVARTGERPPTIQPSPLLRLLHGGEVPPPQSEDAWVAEVQRMYTRDNVMGPYNFDDWAEGLEWARGELDGDDTLESSDVANAQEFAAGSAFHDLLSENPEYVGQLDTGIRAPTEGVDPVLLWMIQVHGPIDPDGPNGWLLRAADGEEVPEDAYISFAPPAPPSAIVSEETE